MEILTLFVVLGLILAFIFRRLKMRALRKAASYRLYAVRDELVCLVAEGKISEHSKIFSYYYKRINRLLSFAPNVGIDHAINALIYLKKSKGFESDLKAAEIKADEMLKLVEKEPEEVSKVISDFYAASRLMILAHSSVLKLCFILMVKSPLARFSLFKRKVKKIVPHSTYTTIKVLKFADREAEQFKEIYQHAA